MRLGSIITLYMLFWAFSFLLMLPFRLQAREGEDADVPGQMDGAPPRFSFGRTAFWATIVAAVLFGLYYANYVEGWVAVRDLNLVPNRVIDRR